MTTTRKTVPLPPPVPSAASEPPATAGVGPRSTPPPAAPSLLAEAWSQEEAPSRMASRTTAEKLAESGWDSVAAVEYQPGKFEPRVYEVRCLHSAARQRVAAGPGGAVPDALPVHECPAGGPPPKAAPPPTPTRGVDAEARFELRAGDAALTRLEARATAPQDEQARVGADLRASLEPYRQRALACALRLEPYRDQAEDVLKRLTALEVKGKITEWELLLGGESTLVRQLRDTANRLRPNYQQIIAGDLSVPSVGSRLARIGPRIDALTAKDVHLDCPGLRGTRPGCGCTVAQIRTQVEDCEGMVTLIEPSLRIIAEKFERIDHVLTARRHTGSREFGRGNPHQHWRSARGFRYSGASGRPSPPVPQRRRGEPGTAAALPRPPPPGDGVSRTPKQKPTSRSDFQPRTLLPADDDAVLRVGDRVRVSFDFARWVGRRPTAVLRVATIVRTDEGVIILGLQWGEIAAGGDA